MTQPDQAAAALQFPADFVWGTATASYQVEGAVGEDGRTVSIWDTFSHTPGKVVNGDTGDVACDHYHRYREDVALMKDLGIRSYRFSMAWPRVIPRGSGDVNPAGIGFYDRLVDSLLGAGIAPVVTLYHWDLPQELQDAGGWVNRDTAYRFADYAAAAASALGDRISLYTTLNEPWCSAFLGHSLGIHAPGHTDTAEAFAAQHHLLLGHGLAVARIREAAPGVPVSITHVPACVRPASDRPEDVAAAHKADAFQTRSWIDPLVGRGYPQEVIEATAAITGWDFVADGDLEIISAPIDVLGVNFYNPSIAGAAATPQQHPLFPGCDDVAFHELPGERTAMGWPVDPTGLTELLLRLHRDYGLPLMVTENGSAWADEVSADGQIHDAQRVSYLHQHLVAAHRALTEGADLRGYFVWSLMDNFEWAEGYDKRFGIVRVDFDTQQRTVKDSGRFYQQVIAAGAVPALP